MTPLPDPNITTGRAGGNSAVSPQAGMSYAVIASADPTGKMVTGSAVLLSLPSAAYSSSIPTICTFSTQYITSVAYDATVTSFSGGSSPTITFLFDRQGADGNWYPILPPSGSGVATVATAATVSIDIGLLPQSLTGGGTSPVYGSAHNVFTAMSRVRWAFGGTPATCTFSLSVIGR